MIRGFRNVAFVIGFVGIVSQVGQTAWAQLNPFGFTRQGVVGGVSVDAEGVVQSASQIDRSGALTRLREVVRQTPGEMNQPAELRMVSLAGIQQELKKAVENGVEISEDIRYLAGLQRVDHVFVYPEQNDIVIAGPAEGWIVREDASVVGVVSGRPVLQLEDLLVALRCVPGARQQAITVSIEPTPEGQQAVNRLLSQLVTGPGFSPNRVEPAIRKAFGPQLVKLTTVPPDSRMAQTLVAADYQMKRLAMNLESSPIGGLPSYMEMIRDVGSYGGTQPRWWIASKYDAILHSEDQLAWQLTGSGIQAMTEEQFVSSAGIRSAADRQNKQAQKWADLFTTKYDELSQHISAFGELRNVMDLNVVATIIR
ncbi:MAG: DUF1598 domain-containing protein, partial [Planctomycetales bacterium]|nr:DUF1598 domain-containing protein [Planctomycetales bacterium]